MNNNPRQNNEGLKDSPKDDKQIHSDQAQMDMPEVKNIPGHEYVRHPETGEYIEVNKEDGSDVPEDGEIGVGD